MILVSAVFRFSTSNQKIVLSEGNVFSSLENSVVMMGQLSPRSGRLVDISTVHGCLSLNDDETTLKQV